MQLGDAIEGWVQANGTALSASTKRDIFDIVMSVERIGYERMECIDVREPHRTRILAEADGRVELSADAIGQFLSIVLDWAAGPAVIEPDPAITATLQSEPARPDAVPPDSDVASEVDLAETAETAETAAEPKLDEPAAHIEQSWPGPDPVVDDLGLAEESWADDLPPIVDPEFDDGFIDDRAPSAFRSGLQDEDAHDHQVGDTTELGLDALPGFLTTDDGPYGDEVEPRLLGDPDDLSEAVEPNPDPAASGPDLDTHEADLDASEPAGEGDPAIDTELLDDTDQVEGTEEADLAVEVDETELADTELADTELADDTDQVDGADPDLTDEAVLALADGEQIDVEELTDETDLGAKELRRIDRDLDELLDDHYGHHTGADEDSDSTGEPADQAGHEPTEHDQADDDIDYGTDDDIDYDIDEARFKPADPAVSFLETIERSAPASNVFGELAQEPIGAERIDDSGVFSEAATYDGSDRGIDWITVAYFGVALICFALVIYFYFSS